MISECRLNRDHRDGDVKIFGFGNLPGMRRVASCSSVEHLRSDVHEYLKERFNSGHLCGSLAIKRSVLNYQHFVLDFDLKKNHTVAAEKVTREEFKRYVSVRNNTAERQFMTSVDRESQMNFNANYFVYEIVYFLTEVLKLDWLPIYIFGKGGTFQNGFHLEIPHLIMSYHDVSVLSNACHNFIPNAQILDAPANYSCLGSHKYRTNESFQSVSEFHCAYLPYVVYDKGVFSDTPTINNFSEAFDTFNIFKPLASRDKIYAFQIFTRNALGESNVNVRRIINILREHDSGQNEKYIDNTVPESETRSRLNANSEVSELAAVILANISSSLENDDDDDEDECVGVGEDEHRDENFFSYLVGFKSHKTLKNSYEKILLYKRLKLDPELDFEYYRDVLKKLFNYGRIISEEMDQDSLISFMKKKNFKIYLHQLPNYGVGDERALETSFTNAVMVPHTIRVTDSPSESDDSWAWLPIQPFNVQHVLKLCALDGRRSNTVYFLVSLYFLGREVKSLEYYSALGYWLFCLCLNGDLILFLNVFDNLKSRVRDNTLQLSEAYQNWSILCLKHLLIVEDVMSFSEACALFASGHVNVKNVVIPGAMHDIKIPQIVSAYLVNGHDTHSQLVYEILALYRPMIQTRNSLAVWDDVGHRWKNCSAHNGTINTALYAPDIHHVGNLFSSLRNQQPVEEEDEKKNDDEPAGPAGPAGSAQKRTSDVKNENDKKRPRYTSTLVNNIQAYWCGISLLPIPSIVWKFPDCYFLTGTSHHGQLVDLLPLPMYHTPSDGEIARGVDSFELARLMRHWDECPFVQEQLYPIFWRLIDRKGVDERAQVNVRHREGADLRHVIDSRDSFVQVFDDLAVQVDMEVNENHTGGVQDARSQIPCDVAAALREKRRLAGLSRDQYHLELVERQWNDETHELVKLVKFFVLKDMSNSYRDMHNVVKLVGKNRQLARTLKQYVHQSQEERDRNETARIKVLARALHGNLYAHPHMSQVSEIGIDEFTETRCDCALTSVFVTLLQAFSYDVVALRYVLSLIVASVCLGNKLKSKEIHFFLGNTNSGKTQFLNLLLSVVGDMGGILSSHTLNHGCSQDRLHDLGKSGDHARFWYSDEIPDKALSCQFIKKITGRSPTWVRVNYGAGRMVVLAPSIFIFGNNKPTFNENCPALIDRLRFFTFRSVFNSKEPTSFRASFFPQLQSYETIQSQLTLGMTALLLHVTCHRNFNSPLFLFDSLGGIEPPVNARESTVRYSPTVALVRTIMRVCNLVDQPTGVITVKRVWHLVTHLNVLKSVSVSSPSDALKFLDKFYPKSSIPNESIECPPAHKDCRQTVIYQGIREQSISENDEKILKLQKKEHNKMV